MHYYVRMSFGNINWNDLVKKKKGHKRCIAAEDIGDVIQNIDQDKMTKIRSQERMYNVITTLKFKTHYNPVNNNNKTGFHNNNGKRWKCEKCSNRFFKYFKEVKDHKADYHSY